MTLALLSPWARAGSAPCPSSCAVGGLHLAVVAATARGEVGTHQLSYRDEEIVLRSRQGELPHEIARTLGHDLLDVMRAFNRATVLGLPIRP